jgi:N,N'-diacetyllegionaminate synthase
MKSLSIGTSRIGPGERCFIIAEVGVNHNGCVRMAHRLIEYAAVNQANAVKFQTFNPEKLVSPIAPKATYQHASTWRKESQLEMLRSLLLPESCYPDLIRHSADLGLVFISTPFDEDSSDFLESLGVPAFKISSGDLTNLPLLGHLANKHLPLIVSTGMASLEEVDTAVEVIASHDNSLVALLHCVSNYPALPEDCNLRAIETLRHRFGVPVGWSDHTQGLDIATAAVALGADILEKHLTLSSNLPGPDHSASLAPEDFGEMVKAIRRVELALGNGAKRRVRSEEAIAVVARRSLHWSNGLSVGAIVRREDLIALRPGTGISPSQREGLIGRKLKRPVREAEMVSESDLEPIA